MFFIFIFFAATALKTYFLHCPGVYVLTTPKQCREYVFTAVQRKKTKTNKPRKDYPYLTPCKVKSIK